MGGSKDQAPGQDPVQMMQDAALYNRIDQYTPDGSVVYSGDERNIATVNLSPEQQALKEQRDAMTASGLTEMGGMFAAGASPGNDMFGGAVDEMSGLAAVLGNIPGLDLSGLAALPGVGDFGAERSRVEKSQFDRSMNLINPENERQIAANDQRLVNRGVPEIGELADVISGRQATNYSNARGAAAQDAVRAGGEEQSRLYGQALGARKQGLQEALAGVADSKQTRDMLFREIMGAYGAGQGQDTSQFNRLAALLGMSQIGSPGAGMGGFWQPGQVDVMGANQTAQQGFQLNQQYDLTNQLMEAGVALGGAALAGGTKSSVEVKTDFAPIDESKILDRLETLDVSSWRYKGDDARHIGPMAEDFEVAFGLPAPRIDGVKGISLVDAFGVAIASIKALTARVKELEGR